MNWSCFETIVVLGLAVVLILAILSPLNEE